MQEDLVGGEGWGVKLQGRNLLLLLLCKGEDAFGGDWAPEQ